MSDMKKKMIIVDEMILFVKVEHVTILMCFGFEAEHCSLLYFHPDKEELSWVTGNQQLWSKFTVRTKPILHIQIIVFNHLFSYFFIYYSLLGRKQKLKMIPDNSL